MPILLIILAVVVVVLAVIAVLRFRSSGAGGAPASQASPHPTPARSGPAGLGGKIKSLFAAGVGEEQWRGVEELLLRADVGPKMSRDITARVRERYTSGADPEHLLVVEIAAALGDDTGLRLRDGGLSVIMVVGVNGSGKTTTIGKLAGLLAKSGKKVSLAASDTFRAAAGEQLEVWAERAGAHLVGAERGADPGSVAFDAVKAAQARGSDVIIVDTAGRLHTRTPLMDELQKVKRVLEKAAGRVDEVVLVLDATTGQNGIAQARAFTEAVGVTGVALAKLDGTAKGGIVLAVRDELDVPVKLVGTGEAPDDIEPFDPKVFAERLVMG